MEVESGVPVSPSVFPWPSPLLRFCPLCLLAGRLPLAQGPAATPVMSVSRAPDPSSHLSEPGPEQRRHEKSPGRPSVWHLDVPARRVLRNPRRGPDVRSCPHTRLCDEHDASHQPALRWRARQGPSVGAGVACPAAEPAVTHVAPALSPVCCRHCGEDDNEVLFQSSPRRRTETQAPRGAPR